MSSIRLRRLPVPLTVLLAVLEVKMTDRCRHSLPQKASSESSDYLRVSENSLKGCIAQSRRQT